MMARIRIVCAARGSSKKGAQGKHHRAATVANCTVAAFCALPTGWTQHHLFIHLDASHLFLEKLRKKRNRVMRTQS
jgi:hypothetical protein